MRLTHFVLALLLCTNNLVVQGITTKIGAIVDMDSRMGKEQKMALQIAVAKFNNASNFKISIQFIYYNQSPLQTAFAAEALVKKNKVEVIIVGIDHYPATTLVAEVGTLAQVPILSLAASPPVTTPFASLRWPFLVQLSHNATQEIQNIASIIHTYHWRRVILVYDASIYGDGGKISLVIEALQKVGCEIEYHLVLPSIDSITDPKHAIKEAFMKFDQGKYYSRVFIVLRVSLSLVNLLFEEAKWMGIMGDKSVWITTRYITDFLPIFDESTMLNMEGVIGIMTKFDNSSFAYKVFEEEFRIRFLQEYEKEKYNEPNFQALLAYDAITTVAKAKRSLADNKIDDVATSNSFLNKVLRTNFKGLSGEVFFKNNILVENAKTRLMNIASANYVEVLEFSHDDTEDEDRAKALAREVIWPSKLKSPNYIVPKGWVMPTYMIPMRIGVPIPHNYRNFIDYKGRTQINDDCSPRHTSVLNHNADYNGYCIAIFNEVLNLLDYELPHEFIPHCGPYDDLVHLVHNKTLDAPIGDITILAERSELVDFTLPYEESGLSIVLPIGESYKSHGPWILLKPFTSNMWLVTFFVLLDTMFVIWVLEHGHNLEFGGSWKNQLSATAWFAFNSLYFAQGAKISSKLARVFVIIWFFIVLILTTSYTANLKSMITNQRLNQTTIDIEMLQRTNVKVGYVNSTLVKQFLEHPLRFRSTNLIGIQGRFEELHNALQAGTISAACLEVIYAQLFVKQHCNQYIMTKAIHRFGGFGFVFPKGSPITADFSEAILKLIENGQQKQLENQYLNTTRECSITSDDSKDNHNASKSSLNLESFQLLFYMSGATTTMCLVASLIPLCKNYMRGIRT